MPQIIPMAIYAVGVVFTEYAAVAIVASLISPVTFGSRRRVRE